jgi:hypothetical protein
MNKTKVKVLRIIPDLQYDNIEVMLNGEFTQIVFAKSDNVKQHDGKEIYLEKPLGGDFIISKILNEVPKK